MGYVTSRASQPSYLTVTIEVSTLRDSLATASRIVADIKAYGSRSICAMRFKHDSCEPCQGLRRLGSKCHRNPETPEPQAAEIIQKLWRGWIYRHAFATQLILDALPCAEGRGIEHRGSGDGRRPRPQSAVPTRGGVQNTFDPPGTTHTRANASGSALPWARLPVHPTHGLLDACDTIPVHARAHFCTYSYA